MLSKFYLGFTLEFKNEIGRLQRLVSAGSAGISRRQAVLEALIINPNDHIIDIGPEGGEAGGNVICEGTPEEVAEMSIGETSKYLAKELLKN